MHFFSYITILLWAIALQTAPSYATVLGLNFPILQIKSSSDQNFRCLGIAQDSLNILTLSHCLRYLDKNSIKISTLKKDGSWYDESKIIREIMSFSEDPLSYPYQEWAIIKLESALNTHSNFSLPEPSRFKDSAFLTTLWRHQTKCKTESEKCAKTLQPFLMTNPIDLKIPGMPSIFKAEINNGYDVCVGDSGSPIFKKKGSRWEFWGLILGDWPPVTGIRKRCLKAFIIGQAPQKEEWPTKIREKPRQAFKESWSEIKNACRERDLATESGIILQDIFNQILAGQLSNLGSVDYCNLVEQRFKELLMGVNHIWINGNRPVQGFNFLANWPAWRLTQPSLTHLQEFLSVMEPKDLIIESSTEEIGKLVLKKKSITFLAIKYQNLSPDFYQLLEENKEIKRLELVGVKIDKQSILLTKMRLPPQVESISIRESSVCCNDFKGIINDQRYKLKNVRWTQ